jgi:hypothetical protein
MLKKFKKKNKNFFLFFYIEYLNIKLINYLLIKIIYQLIYICYCTCFGGLSFFYLFFNNGFF